MDDEEQILDLIRRNPDMAKVMRRLLERVEDMGSDRPSDTFGDFEDALEDDVDELFRRGLGKVLERKSRTADVVETGGERYAAMPEATLGEYFSRRGPVAVMRPLYRKLGVRNGPTIVPFELELGFVDGLWTPGAAKAAARLLQDQTARDAVEAAQDLRVMRYSRSSLQRCAGLMGSRWEDIREDVEPSLRRLFTIPENATSLSLGVDRVSVPMDERATGNGVQPRMAWCGVWTLHDADGEPLHSVRYGRMPGEDVERLVESMRLDVEAIVAARPAMPVVGLTDGAPEMRAMVERIVAGLDLAIVHHGIDFYHVSEHLGEVAKLLTSGKKVCDAWRARLLNDPRGPAKVMGELRDLATADPERVGPVASAACAYLERNDDRMAYFDLRARGMPVGSGHVEATCKTLVATRMRRSGSRWSVDGGQAILHLRSLARSHRWDPAMAAVQSSFRQPVRASVRPSCI